jgi:hypothetical protein
MDVYGYVQESARKQELYTTDPTMKARSAYDRRLLRHLFMLLSDRNLCSKPSQRMRQCTVFHIRRSVYAEDVNQ